MTNIATLVFLLRGDEVLLIRKKRGFGQGKYNGVGGKVEQGENLVDAARREVLEEVGVKVGELEYRGVLEFYSSRREPDWVVHVFVSTDFEGEPRPS
ncbi:MAG: 8-oxo-dGTP diphosphatase, partial [Thermofilum sp.]